MITSLISVTSHLSTNPTYYLKLFSRDLGYTKVKNNTNNEVVRHAITHKLPYFMLALTLIDRLKLSHPFTTVSVSIDLAGSSRTGVFDRKKITTKKQPLFLFTF